MDMDYNGQLFMQQKTPFKEFHTTPNELLQRDGINCCKDGINIANALASCIDRCTCWTWTQNSWMQPVNPNSCMLMRSKHTLKVQTPTFKLPM